MTDIVYNKNGIAFDIDALATDVNGKMDRDGLNSLASVCVESYQDGASWYRVYSDGWCEQGASGVSVASSTGTTVVTSTISLLKPYSSENYGVQIQGLQGNTSGSSSRLYVSTKNSSSFILTIQNSIFSGGTIDWQASGYIR